MRSKKAIINFITAIVELMATIVSSFVVPHYIIKTYGSDINGLVSSITQFLSYISLIDSGIGAIGRASLYKPLANGNNAALSSTTMALEGFYRKIGYIFLAYVAVLACAFPFLVREFTWGFSAVLVVVLAFSTIIQYFFGITYQTVAQADQRKYIVSLLQAATLMLNMAVTVTMVRMGCGIIAVKTASAITYAIRPLFLFAYVSKHYHISKSAKPDNAILKQRWDGLAHHIAFFIHKNTDIVVLTILANVKEVSVYSVYMLVVSGCSKVVNIFSASLEPAFGNMIAKGEKKVLEERMNMCVTVTIQVTVMLFTTAALIITPFIQLYTKNVTDVDYLRPAFGKVMLIAEALYCVRMPYQSAVYAAGHFKETRNGAIVEAGINIVLSVILVFHYGLIGVAIGTLAAMLCRTIEYIIYYNKKIIEVYDLPKSFFKRLLISISEIVIIVFIAKFLPNVSSKSYISWFMSSIIIGFSAALVVLAFSILFYGNDVKYIMTALTRMMKKIRKG